MSGLKNSPGPQQLDDSIQPARLETPGNTGLTQAFSSIASDFSQVGSQVSQLADQAAQTAGSKAGEDAGLDPEFRPTHSLTIYDKAFDAAGLNVYKTNVTQQMQADLAKAYDQHQGDPLGFQQAAQAKRQAWLDGSLPDVRSDLALSFDKSQFALFRDAVRVQHERMDAENRGALDTEITTRSRQIQQRAYSAGLDPAADDLLAGDVADLQKVLQRQGLNGAPLVSPEAASKIVQSAKDETTQSRVLGAFDRLPSTDAKEQFLRQFQQDFKDGNGAATSMGLQNYESTYRRLLYDMRQQRFLDKATMHEIGGQVRAASDAMERGFAPSEDDMAALKAQAAQIQDPKMRNALDQAERDYSWQKDARSWSPQQLSGWINDETARIQRESGKPEDVHRLDLASKLLQNMHSGLKQDALGWATRVGYIQPQPLDFSNGDKLAQSLQSRISQAEAVSEHYGQPPQYFTPDERHALATTIAQGGAQSLAVLGALNQGAGASSRALIQELAPNAPAVAALAAHVADAGVTPAATDAADGLALRKQKDAKGLTPLPKPSDTEEAARRELHGVLDRDPTSKMAVIDLANAVYQVRAARKGLDSFDSDVWRQGLREIAGQRQTPDGTTYGGVVNQGTWHRNPIVLPPYVRQDGWRQAIDAIQPGDLPAAGLGSPVGGDGKPISLDRLKNSTLVQVGDGRYLMATGSVNTPGAEGYIMRDDGKRPFVLDFRQLAPVIGARRPDLFLTPPGGFPRRPIVRSPAGDPDNDGTVDPGKAPAAPNPLLHRSGFDEEGAQPKLIKAADTDEDEKIKAMTEDPAFQQEVLKQYPDWASKDFPSHNGDWDLLEDEAYKRLHPDRKAVSDPKKVPNPFLH